MTLLFPVNYVPNPIPVSSFPGGANNIVPFNRPVPEPSISSVKPSYVQELPELADGGLPSYRNNDFPFLPFPKPFSPPSVPGVQPPPGSLPIGYHWAIYTQFDSFTDFFRDSGANSSYSLLTGPIISFTYGQAYTNLETDSTGKVVYVIAWNVDVAHINQGKVVHEYYDSHTYAGTSDRPQLKLAPADPTQAPPAP